MCGTTLASNILQVSLGTGYYLCRGGVGGKHWRGVKAISDCLEAGGKLNFFIKTFRGSVRLWDSQILRKMTCAQLWTKTQISWSRKNNMLHCTYVCKVGIAISLCSIFAYAVELSSELFHCISFWLSVPINLRYLATQHFHSALGFMAYRWSLLFGSPRKALRKEGLPLMV